MAWLIEHIGDRYVIRKGRAEPFKGPSFGEGLRFLPKPNQGGYCPGDVAMQLARCLGEPNEDDPEDVICETLRPVPPKQTQ
jgi:hypothetical protein